MISRREFLVTASAAAGAAAGAAATLRATTDVERRMGGGRGFQGRFCLFSKHLPGLDWAALGGAVREAGFDGVDLTVRPKGHVEPSRAREDLPRAIEAIRQHGTDVPMITTELLSASDPTARPILEAAAKSGVRYFKPGYYRYALSDVRAELAEAGRALAGLAELAQSCGIELGFHNHEGYLGASLWDIAPEMDKLPEKWAGYYFDVRHAVVEGGGVGWKSATRRVAPRLKMIAIKDLYWEKTDRGWHVANCPLGEGMVDWTWYSKAVAQAGFQGPVSVHLEYEKDGVKPDDTARTLADASRDLKFIQRHFTQAYA
jgi:L-ribulose-5-phosphate 3-epimerase